MRRLHIREHRVVKLDRKSVFEAFLAHDRLAYLCVDLACPHVGTVVYAAVVVEGGGESPMHMGRNCVLYPLTPPVGIEIALDELEPYGQALLDGLTFGTGDSAYIPEITWKFEEDDAEESGCP